MSRFINNYNKRTVDDYKVRYILVPERHKDGAWHMHGFVKGIRPDDLYVNEYGFTSWKQYCVKFGFISMSPIKDIDRASSYITKYLSKDLANSVTDAYSHLYYASHGLNKPIVIYKGKAELLCDWDFIHPDNLCKIKTLDTRKTDLSEVLRIV